MASPDADHLTASSDSVPRRDPQRLTLGDCWRHFVRQPSPPLLAGAIVVAFALEVT